MSSILLGEGGYYDTQYRVRSYLPFGYSILYKEYNLTGFNHEKKQSILLLGLGLPSCFSSLISAVYIIPVSI